MDENCLAAVEDATPSTKGLYTLIMATLAKMALVVKMFTWVTTLSHHPFTQVAALLWYGSGLCPV
jgi:hypothetical protein